MPYNYLTFGDLQTALLERLQDTSASGVGTAVFTTIPEARLYLMEALQTLNAQAPVWNADQKLDFSPGNKWKSLNFAGSVRERTVTDSDLFTVMQYHFLEPPSGSTWTGTTQFTIEAFATALQARMSEILQGAATNVQSLPIPSPTTTVRTALPDTVLQLRRVRWVPKPALGHDAYALGREDVTTANAYYNSRILTVGEPESYYVTSTPPLYFDCTQIPPVPGDWDLLALLSGPSLSPPAPSLMPIPNDWTWVAKWGAMADLLNNSPEGWDALRATYCRHRYRRGMRAMRELPWLLAASVSNVPCDTPSVLEMDAYAQNWEVVWPLDDYQIVVGGMDYVSLAPNVLPTGQLTSAVLTVVGNAPLPANDGAQVLLARDGVEAVLCYAQHLASFKHGGAEFVATFPLLDEFERYCRATNARYAALGILRPETLMEGDRGESIDPRKLGEGRFEAALQPDEEVTADAS